MANRWSMMRTLMILNSFLFLGVASFLPDEASANPDLSALDPLKDCLVRGIPQDCVQAISNVRDQLCRTQGLCGVCLAFQERYLDIEYLQPSDIVDPTLGGPTYIRWIGVGNSPGTGLLVPGQYEIRSSPYGEVLCEGIV